MIKYLFAIASIFFILFFAWLFFPAFDLYGATPLISWQKLSLAMPYKSFYDFSYAVAEKRLFVFNGQNFFYSDDLEKWHEVKETPEFSTYHRDEPFALTWFNNRLWAFFNQDGNAVWSSKDGRNWQLEADKINKSGRVHGKICAFNNKLWLINSWDEGDIFNSDDGKVWNKVGQTGFSNVIIKNLFVFKNELWLIGHDWGNFFKSADGKTWHRVRLKFPGPYRNGATFGVFDDKLWLVGGERGYSMRETIKADPFFFLFFLNPQGTSRKMKDLSDTWYSEDGINWVCNSKSERKNFLEIKAFNLGDRFILIGDAGNFSYNSAPASPEDKYIWEAISAKP